VKKLENRSIFDEVKAYEVHAYKKCASFFGQPCIVIMYTKTDFVLCTGGQRRLNVQ